MNYFDHVVISLATGRIFLSFKISDTFGVYVMVIPHYCEDYNPDNFAKPEAWLVISIKIDPVKGRGDYDSYIAKVRPIVQRYGGEYLLRTEKITALSHDWQPDRMIIIRFPDRQALDECFRSKEYQEIMALRTDSVDANAVIAEEW